jgi:hypothetical protein
MKIILPVLGSALSVSFAGSLLIVLAALQHNTQCELYCDGRVDWGYALTIFASWFLILLPVALAISLFGWLVVKRST